MKSHFFILVNVICMINSFDILSSQHNIHKKNYGHVGLGRLPQGSNSWHPLFGTNNMPTILTIETFSNKTESNRISFSDNYIADLIKSILVNGGTISPELFGINYRLTNITNTRGVNISGYFISFFIKKYPDIAKKFHVYSNIQDYLTYSVWTHNKKNT